jgi:hypothetical protein
MTLSSGDPYMVIEMLIHDFTGLSNEVHELRSALEILAQLLHSNFSTIERAESSKVTGTVLIHLQERSSPDEVLRSVPFARAVAVAAVRKAQESWRPRAR